MAKDFTQMTDAELGACYRSRYDRLCAAHDMGLDDGPHPSERWAADTEILKAHRAATANDEGGLGPVEIQNKAKRSAQDNPPPTPNTPKPPVQDGKTTIIEKPQDRYMVGSDNVPRFEYADGRVLFGNDAIIARSQQSNRGRVRVMKTKIAGYDRIK
jgi:hypothetical protein